MKKYSTIITGIMIVFITSSPLIAKNLKPRVLVIPFDNMMGNNDYEWMKESISENLKEKLIKTNRFEVMDVQLLRQINPDIRFADLTAEEATGLAKRLNCEAAIIGRYITKKKDDTMNALIQIEAVNAISAESIVIKSEYADLDGTVFDRVADLSKMVANEFVAKLPPVSSVNNTRDNSLEKLIYRLEHPPKGFLDTFSFDAANLENNQKKKIRFRPDFDIDTLEYDLYLPEGIKEVEYKYVIWGKNFTPYVTAGSKQCFKVCAIENDEVQMLVSKTANQGETLAPTDNLKKNQSEAPLIYKIRIHRQSPPGPVFGRWWLSAGYPYMQSLSLINPKGNPKTLTSGGAFPFDGMGGILSVETGFAPGRWQLPVGINWSLVAQFQYGKGNFYLNSVDSGLSATIDMYSMGGGLRFDRPFSIGDIYAISPVIGFYAHYQIFSQSKSRASFYLMGLNPEVGINQYFRLGAGSKWKVALTTIFGSYLYQGQNLSYLKVNLGVEYAIK